MKSMTQPQTFLPERPQIETQEFGRTDPAPQLWPAASLPARTRNVRHMHIAYKPAPSGSGFFMPCANASRFCRRLCGPDYLVDNPVAKGQHRATLEGVLRTILIALATGLALDALRHNHHLRGNWTRSPPHRRN